MPTPDPQPKVIPVDDDLTLVKYYPNYARTLPWYQNLQLCRQVDHIDHPYDLQRLRDMYRYLSRNGECYYIKYRDQGRWRLVGDISLWHGSIAIVICPAYQNRHLGRRAVAAMLSRARSLGWTQVDAEIYTFNTQSQRMFLASGFTRIGDTLYRFTL